MARVTGIGGVFLRSPDPKALVKWYAANLGIILSDFGGAAFEWTDEVPEGTGMTAWSTFPPDTSYFGDGPQPFMINYRVDDLDALLAHLTPPASGSTPSATTPPTANSPGSKTATATASSSGSPWRTRNKPGCRTLWRCPPHPSRRRAPVWLMGLSNATIGLAGGFIVLPLPQMLAAQGVPEIKIAAISAACLSPGSGSFCSAPCSTSDSPAASMPLYLQHLPAWTHVGRPHARAPAHPRNPADGRLRRLRPELQRPRRMARRRHPRRSRAEGDNPNHEGARLSAWTQVGLFLGNGLMAGIAAEGMRRLPLTLIAPLLGALVVLPAAVFPWIPVPNSPPRTPRNPP